MKKGAKSSMKRASTGLYCITFHNTAVNLQQAGYTECKNIMSFFQEWRLLGTFQKTPFFIVTAVKTSNLTQR
jgi:hypothetical protein